MALKTNDTYYSDHYAIKLMMPWNFTLGHFPIPGTLGPKSTSTFWASDEVQEKQMYHLAAASDEQSHHFAEEACLQWIEISIRLQECIDGVE